jgi:hypothetical protein
MSDCPFSVGDRIIEKQHNSDPRTVQRIAPGEYVVVQGFIRTKIAWRNLKRYRLVQAGEAMNDEQVTEDGGYTRKRIPESAWPEHLRFKGVEELMRERDRYREALDQIAASTSRPVAWSSRIVRHGEIVDIAREALNGEAGKR